MGAGPREARLIGVEAVHAWDCMCGCLYVDFILLDSSRQESLKERERMSERVSVE